MEVEEQYCLLIEILRSGILGKFPAMIALNTSKPLHSNEMYLSKVTCFCDIPVADLPLHMEKYSKFGLAFKKPFMLAHGAIPVYYIPSNSILNHHFDGETAADCFNSAHKHMLDVLQFTLPKTPPAEHDDYLWHQSSELIRFLTSYFFSYCKFFNVGINDDDPDNFYMEREWRLHGKLNFSIEEVSRVIFPQEYAIRFRKDLPEYIGQINFS
jgi:hypothetical protein